MSGSFPKKIFSGLSLLNEDYYIFKPGFIVFDLVSDLSIALAYFFIAGILAYCLIKRPNMPFKRAFWSLAILMVVSAISHSEAFFKLWYPHYWLFGLIKGLKIIISFVTVIFFIPVARKVLAMPNPIQLEITNQELEKQLRKHISSEESIRHV